MRKVNWEPVVVLILVAAFPLTARSQSSARKAAVTSLAETDADFRFMGEYLGDLAGADGVRHRTGLQVVALGDGQFSAVQYAGGLPGNGWDRSTPQVWEGTREVDQLVLLQGDGTIQIQGGSAIVVNPQDGLVGTLPKVLRRSCTMGAEPPPWGTVLFDGSDTSAFKNAKVRDGLLQVGTEMVGRFRDFTLHLEFCVPYMPHARGQSRGNSGVYLQSRYEIQILDSFGLKGDASECGGLYRYVPPQQNMAFPPLSWQTYDITFQSPRFDAEGNKTQDARLTVLHNGVPVHNCLKVERKTGAGRPESPELLPTKLQDHGNPVQFRNVWLTEASPAGPAPSKSLAVRRGL